MSYLSEDQRCFFARNGFLQIAGAIPETACHELVKWTEERLPQGWRSDDPDTWEGAVQDACHVNSLVSRRGRLQFRVTELDAQPLLKNVYGHSSTIAAIAEDLIGHALARVMLRGLYPIFPLKPGDEFDRFHEAHNEAHPSQLITVGYLSDVERGGGGLLVWPGSHRAVYPSMSSKLEYVAGPNYNEVFNDWTCREPVELAGSRGDVIIMHHRLLHAPSVNISKRVRFAFLSDYRRDDFERLCTEQPSSELWEDWPAIRRLPHSELSRGFDYILPRQLRSRRMLSAAEKLRDRTTEANATTKRKGDASILERMRHVGDQWLVISDSELSKNDWKLFPRGSDLSAQSVIASVNGTLIKSICQYDIFWPVPADTDLRQIKVRNLRSKAWLRLVQTRLPLAASDVHLKIELPPGSSTLRVRTDGYRVTAERITPLLQRMLRKTTRIPRVPTCGLEC